MYTVEISEVVKIENIQLKKKVFKVKLYFFFISITQKARVTYIRVLGGTGGSGMWSNVVEGTGKLGKNTESG